MHKRYSLFSAPERRFAESLSRLARTNPFVPERIELEKQALGSRFNEAAEYWVPDAGALELNATQFVRPNLRALGERATEVANAARARWRQGAQASDHELELYQDLCLYVLFYRYDAPLFELSRDPTARPKALAWYESFRRDYHELLEVEGINWPVPMQPELALALLFQLRRAFHYVFRYLLGSSPVSARLRAETWHSIFTHDLKRYRQSLFRRMHDIATLITGPTGSGKELVAQAIGLSRFVPFDAKRRAFTESFADQFHALHLAALPVSLVESELFGHRRGAFTGAVEDRTGWLEASGPAGTIFLDEVGELPAEVQVKLLRAIDARTFNRLGESKPRAFLGKLVAATHRDLAREMRAGRFRPDLFHRLSADQIRTPALRERIASDPNELPYLVAQLSRRVAGEESAAEVTRDTLAFIERELGYDYSWPGNIRELEQCVRSVVVRGRYEPPRDSTASQRDQLDRQLLESGLSLKQLEQRYARLVYQATGNYSEAARRLAIDRRTVRDHVEAELEGPA